MSTAIWFVIPGVVVAFLLMNLLKRLASDRIEAFSASRRSTSRLVTRGELFDGSRHLQVSLALTDSAFIYENSDMQATLERRWIQEVEYENELSTGQPVGKGKVLRLRCFSKTFEFVLPRDVVRQWESVLPPHRMVTALNLAGAKISAAASPRPPRTWSHLHH